MYRVFPKATQLSKGQMGGLSQGFTIIETKLFLLYLGSQVHNKDGQLMFHPGMTLKKRKGTTQNSCSLNVYIGGIHQTIKRQIPRRADHANHSQMTSPGAGRARPISFPPTE